MEYGKETIEKIEELVKEASANMTLDGKVWSTRRYERVLFEPLPDPMNVSTLSGFADFITANIDRITLTDVAAMVRGPEKVSLVSKLQGEKLDRATYITASVDSSLKQFQFEKYIETEQFIVTLRSMFEQSKDLDKIISYVSKIKGGESFSLEDDGVSQVASSSKGVSGALTEKATAPAIVRLRPFRTFRDIEQVESEFLFRMKLINTDDKIVGCALFEADGGRWRNQATLAIRDYIKEALPGLAVIA